MKILASGPSGPPGELDPLRAAGHEVVIGRPLDQPGRAAYTDVELGAAARDCYVILASHLDAYATCGTQALRLVSGRQWRGRCRMKVSALLPDGASPEA